MSEPKVYERVTEVTVCAVPEDNITHHSYAITVAWRGDETYAVTHYRRCLGTDGEWDFEPSPGSRTDKWIATHRFAYDTALRLARAAAPGVTVNGWSAAQIVADIEASKETHA